MMGFSNEQRDIIGADIGNVLVSAGAGAGKTTVLVERIIRNICSDKVSVDSILVVTFTREAASNMKAKIDKALRKRIAEEQDSDKPDTELIDKLKRQLELIPNAYIMTLDSFCSRVIKEKGYVISDSENSKLLESGSVILDNSELKLILSKAASEAINESYFIETDGSKFYTLTNMFGNGRTDDALIDSLVTAYNSMRSIPDYLSRCEENYNKRIGCNNNGLVIGLPEVVKLIVDLYRFIDEARTERMIELINQAEYSTSSKEKDREKMNKQKRGELSFLVRTIYNYVSEVVALYDKQADANGNVNYGDAGTIYELIRTAKSVDEIDFVSFNNIKKCPANDGIVREFFSLFGPWSAVRLLLSQHLGLGKNPAGYKDSYIGFSLPSSYSAILCKSVSELLELQINRTEIVGEYLKLIRKMDEKYLLYKSRVNGMDFADQEHIAKQILETIEGSEYYRNKFAEIYIDEYQDNSELQDAIIHPITSEGGNVFRVGDVKQSIYKFRNAEPKLFIDCMDDYSSENSNGSLKVLNRNYRSAGKILDFVNAFFRQLMTRDGSEIEYDSNQELLKYEEAEDGEEPRVLIVNNHGNKTSTYGSDGKTISCDYIGVLDEVKRYIDEYKYEPKDVCVLTRTRRGASQVSEYLTECGYPARYADEVSIFADENIRTVISTIIALANSMRDEYLLGVLLAPFKMTNFSLDDLAEFYIEAKKNDIKNSSLINILQVYAEHGNGELRDRVNAFLDWFNDFRNDMVITDISVVFDRIVRDSGMISSGKQVTSKLSIFKSWLCDNYIRYGSDIKSVADSLEKMKIKLGTSASVKREDVKDNRITCMTYHSSKGLEYDCVIITDMNNRKGSDKSGPIVFGSDGSFIVNDYVEDDVCLNDSFERILFNQNKKLSENSENIRLLYVALTRAKAKLSIVFSLNLDDGDTGSSEICADMKLAGRYPSASMDKNFWLNHSGGIHSIFISSLLRMPFASRLAAHMSESPMYVSDYRGGELIIEDISKYSSTSSAPVSADDEEETTSDEEVDNTDEVDGEESEVINDLIEPYPFTVENGKMVFKEYKYNDNIKDPFKVSVSQIGRDGINDAVSLTLDLKDFDYYLDVDAGLKSSASEIGTFVHRLMRFIDYSDVDSETWYANNVDYLIDEDIISENERTLAMSFSSQITAFARSEIGRNMASSDNCRFEEAITFAIKSNDDYVLAQGFIDCIYEEDGSKVIIDFKTDDLSGYSADARSEIVRQKHSTQINCYAAAVEASGAKVSHKYIYLLRTGEYVEI